MIYANDVASNFSVTRHEGYLTYSERFRKLYGDGYASARDGSIIVTKAKTINLKKLNAMLKSKDENLFNESKWVWDGDFKFLDGEKAETKIAFNTFPRSGNSFLRRLLEQVTGISTGATVMLHTATSLQCMGLKGEYVVDDRT